MRRLFLPYQTHRSALSVATVSAWPVWLTSWVHRSCVRVSLSSGVGVSKSSASCSLSTCGMSRIRCSCTQGTTAVLFLVDTLFTPHVLTPCSAEHGERGHRRIGDESGAHMPTARPLQPFSEKSLTAIVSKEFQIGLYGVVETDWELFCNSWSAGFLGERL